MTLKKLLLPILSIFFITGIYYIYLNKNNDINKLSSTLLSPEITPTPEIGVVTDLKIVNEVSGYHLPNGEQIYNISHGEEVVGPRAEKISYNPLNISPGKSQVVTVTFPIMEKVSSGVIFITTDHQENQKLVLKKVENTPNNIWSGAWVPNDTVKSRYSVRLYFVGGSGTYNVTSTFI